MHARIYQPAKSAMSSGQGNSKGWVLEYAPEQPRQIDPLMGWTGSGDMRSQVKLKFRSREEAIAYAEKHRIAFIVEEPKLRKANVRPMGYAGNFAHNRRGAWTH
ncbi:MAG: ETC complex I subunit [Pseudomonadota bacterium]